MKRTGASRALQVRHRLIEFKLFIVTDMYILGVNNTIYLLNILFRHTIIH